ncbi:unnamed protein product [Meloidogyne enterolobii]|uniref:Uncharacterized protein n=1 Tax=Meloidogyne enterolobii TaxID=390850 RepID=A0ACB1AXQ7_MELEN
MAHIPVPYINIYHPKSSEIPFAPLLFIIQQNYGKNSLFSQNPDIFFIPSIC